MNKIAKALGLSQSAMAMLETELNRQSGNSAAIGTKSQLEVCKHQLSEMIAQLENNQLPPTGERLIGMGQMIADSWPANSKLGDALLLAEQAYRSA